jgi:hypothetical protein
VTVSGGGGPPQRVFLIRHGEKPPGDTATPGPPFGIDVNPNPNAYSLIPRGWQRSGGLAVLYDPAVGPVRGGLAVPDHLFSPAAGDETASTTTLLALTTTEDGRLRTDPVPLPSPTRDAFGYGGGPSFTYTALLRCALGVSRSQTSTVAKANLGLNDEDGPVSQLWKAISTTTGPLRLSWPQVQLWARADDKRATTST